jgi:hypothetical protein
MDAKPLIIAKFGRKLLDQQLWCWGQDVARDCGNGLVEFGFERRPPPRKHSQVPSMYVWHSGTEQVLLRGFGLIYSQVGVGQIFLRRYEFSPTLLTSTQRTCLHAWTVDNLGEIIAPRCATEQSLAWHLMAECCRWIGEYENWVGENWGLAYRQQTIEAWKHRDAETVTARNLCAAWSRLGLACLQRHERYARLRAG